MLDHQLPALPPVDEFLETLSDVFSWIGGAEPVVLEPIPMLEAIEPAWAAPPTITRWPAGAPLEQIRFAANNHLLVDLYYQGSARLIEPCSLRRSKAGRLLVYALKHETGEVRSYRVDRIEGVRITRTPFTPRYAIDLSVPLPVATGRSGPRQGQAGATLGHAGRAGAELSGRRTRPVEASVRGGLARGGEADRRRRATPTARTPVR